MGVVLALIWKALWAQSLHSHVRGASQMPMKGLYLTALVSEQPYNLGKMSFKIIVTVHPLGWASGSLGQDTC